MEYIEKILFYIIPVLLMLLGWLIAYCIWYGHSKRLKAALSENLKIQEGIASIVTVDLEYLRSKIHDRVNSSETNLGDLLLQKEKMLRENKKLIDKQGIQLVTTKSELQNKKLQLEAVNSSYSHYKYDQDERYDALLKVKNRLQDKVESLESQLSKTSNQSAAPTQDFQEAQSAGD